MYQPTVKSFFSGAGGLDFGLQMAGCNVIESLEYDKTACETLRANFNHKVSERDITKETVTDKEDSDIMALTFPCTKYSRIADIHGTRTGDELSFHAFRHIALKKPEAFVCENVPGLKKFKVTMECFTKIPDYYITTICPLNSSNWLPQKRERLIIIGTRKRHFISEPAPSVKRPLLRDLIEENPTMRIPDYVHSRLAGKYRDLPKILDPANKHEMANCLVSHYGKDQSTCLVKDKSHPLGMRPLSPREYARLQGFPDSFKFSGSDSEIYKQVGNAVSVPMGEWIGQQMIKYFN